MNLCAKSVTMPIIVWYFGILYFVDVHVIKDSQNIASKEAEQSTYLSLMYMAE